MKDELGQTLLSIPQAKLILSDKEFPAFVGGFGSGKSYALVQRAISKKLEYPTLNTAYYLPTYDLISKIAFPYFEEALQEIGYDPYGGRGTSNYGRYRINKNEKELELIGLGKFIYRTMDNNIIGFQVADSCIDELDTLKENDARTIFQKVIARNRQVKPDGKPNTIAVGTTPEGYRFMYQQWERKPPSEQYQIIRASTYSNQHNLPAGYIQSLLDTYPSNLITAYIEGEFINLTSGAVYPDYSRILNGSVELPGPTEALHIGMDFNVGKMAGVVWVPRQGCPHAVAEFTGLLDTPAMIRAIKARFPNNPIWVYPDASGGSRKSNDASVSDLILLRDAGFTVVANTTNPRIKDRVLAMNSMIFVPNRNPERTVFVNAIACPSLAEGLEKQAYDKNGEPDKTSGFDHIVDGATYFIAQRFPVRKNVLTRTKAGGV